MAEQQQKRWDPETGLEIATGGGWDPETGLARPLSATTPVASHDKPKPSFLESLAADLRNPTSVGSIMAQGIPGLGLGRKLGAEAVDVAAHPMDNLPTIAAMAATGGAGGALARTGVQAARPMLSALLRSVAAGTGGAAGAAARGDSAGDAVGRGVGEAVLQGVPDVAIGALRNPLRSLSRGITNASLRPSTQILDQLIDPATGKQFGDRELAARHFGERALDIQPTGTPGRSTYRAGLTAQSDGAQDELQALYRHDPQIRVPDADITPPGIWDRMAKEMTERGSAPVPEALAKANDIADTTLARSQVIPGAAHGAANLPIATPPQRPAEWSLPEMDKLQKGLQADTKKLYDQQQAAQMFGAPLPDNLELEVKQVLRDQLSKLTSSHAPVLPGQRTAPELKAAIRELIPYEQAAIQATTPTWGQSVPNARVSTGGAGPIPLRFQLYEYLGGKSAKAARPARVLSNAAPAAGAQTPQLLRLLSLLSQQGGPVSSHER